MNQSLKFDTLSDLKSFSQYDNLKSLTIKNLDITDSAHLEPLPINLQILHIERVKITRIPVLPLNIREVHVTICKVQSIPDLSEYHDMEVLNLTDNYIEELVNPLPANVREINLNFNKLIHIDHSMIPADTNTFSYSYNKMKIPPPRDTPYRCIHDHNDYDEYLYKLRFMTEQAQRATVAKNIYIHINKTSTIIRFKTAPKRPSDG